MPPFNVEATDSRPSWMLRLPACAPALNLKSLVLLEKVFAEGERSREAVAYWRKRRATTGLILALLTTQKVRNLSKRELV